MKMENNIEIRNSSNLVEYSHSLEFMEKRVNNIFNNKEKELIWCLNHNNIYTIGTSGSKKEIHSKISIPLIKTNRGGKITYHGPGQRIVYFLINLGKRKKDIRKFVNLIENSAIKLLKEFNIESKTFPNRVGIWVTKNNNQKLEREKKIGAIGLRVKKWVTYHGMSFNLNPNLDYYKNIDACGLSEYEQTSMESMGININQKEFDELYIKNFLKLIKDL
jgi:lipoyl(octanoyl) transferase